MGTQTLYLYFEQELSWGLRDRIMVDARAVHLIVGLRDKAYAATMDKATVPVAIIAHVPRTKSLRESIELGLKTIRDCV